MPPTLAPAAPTYLLCPNIFGFKGGLQVYSRFLLEALQNLSPQTERHVFLKYDRQVPEAIARCPQTHFHCFGRWSHRMQSVLLGASVVLRGLGQPPQRLIATHLNYGPVCQGFKRLTGSPYWLVVHGLEGWALDHPQRQAALREAERVLAVSHYTRDRLLAEQDLDPEQVIVLPNTFDASRFTLGPKPVHLLQRYGLRPEQPVILTVSRLGRTTAHQKGYRQVLQALVQVRQQIPDLHYFLVGKGDDQPAAQALVNRLGLQDCVTLTGFVPEEELPAYYQLCDLFALPSCIEGFGIVYLEALASGKPVLAGDRDGAAEPLQQGRLGCLVNPEDRGAIAQGLRQLLQKTYPNPLVYQPQVLRQQAIARFEFARFQQRLGQLLTASAPQTNGGLNHVTKCVEL